MHKVVQTNFKGLQRLLQMNCNSPGCWFDSQPKQQSVQMLCWMQEDLRKAWHAWAFYCFVGSTHLEDEATNWSQQAQSSVRKTDCCSYTSAIFLLYHHLELLFHPELHIFFQYPIQHLENNQNKIFELPLNETKPMVILFRTLVQATLFVQNFKIHHQEQMTTSKKLTCAIKHTCTFLHWDMESFGFEEWDGPRTIFVLLTKQQKISIDLWLQCLLKQWSPHLPCHKKPHNVSNKLKRSLFKPGSVYASVLNRTRHNSVKACWSTISTCMLHSSWNWNCLPHRHFWSLKTLCKW